MTSQGNTQPKTYDDILTADEADALTEEDIDAMATGAQGFSATQVTARFSAQRFGDDGWMVYDHANRDFESDDVWTEDEAKARAAHLSTVLS